MKVRVGVSNRHVHLTEDTYDFLFDGKKIEKRNDLMQPGEYASTDTVDISFGDKTIEHARVLGPFREQNQIELLGSDLAFLELDAPTRRSGDLETTPKVLLKNGEKSIETDGVIRAERHIHVSKSESETLGLYERDKIVFKTDAGEVDAFVKVSLRATLELHIDKDEALEYGLVTGDEVEFRKL